MVKKIVSAICMLMFLIVFSVANSQGATKTIIEKDAQGNELKKTIIETDQHGNETTTIVNNTAEIKPQPQLTPAPAAPAEIQTTTIQQTTTTPQTVTTAAPIITPKKGLKVGSNLIYGRIGMSVPTNKPDGKILIPGYAPLDPSWGVIGFELGGTFLHFISNHFALGGEIGLDAFLGKTDKSTNIEVTQSSVFANFLLLAHIYLNNIEEESRFYVPIGIGFGTTSYTMNVNYAGYSGSDSASGSGTCYVIGLGSNWRNQSGNISGMELRYTQSNVDGSDPDSLKDQKIDILSILFYYGFDF